MTTPTLGDWINSLIEAEGGDINRGLTRMGEAFEEAAAQYREPDASRIVRADLPIERASTALAFSHRTHDEKSPAIATNSGVSLPSTGSAL